MEFQRVHGYNGASRLGSVCRTALAMLAVAAVSISHAAELTIEGGVSPTGQFEIVLLTHAPYASDTDGAPGVVLRDPVTKNIAGQFVWPGDVSNPNAPQLTRAYWSPDGAYVAIVVLAGRAQWSTHVCRPFIEGLQWLQPLPVSEAPRQQHFSASGSSSNGGTVFTRWIDNTTLEILDHTYGKNITWRVVSDGLEVLAVADQPNSLE